MSFKAEKQKQRLGLIPLGRRSEARRLLRQERGSEPLGSLKFFETRFNSLRFAKRISDSIRILINYILKDINQI